MKISSADLMSEVKNFITRHGTFLAGIEAKHGLPPYLLYAVGSRETDLSSYYESHPGDGGHGHGPWQLDDRSHTITAKTTIVTYADIAGQMLHDLLAHFHGDLKSALSAYNAGVGGAERGLRETGNSDQHTTGGDYGQDVQDRAFHIQDLMTKIQN